ncbi:MAG: C13 family peptidase [Candidatus Binatia bacterium]
MTIVLVACALMAACRAEPPSSRRGNPADSSTPYQGATWALLINGGDKPEINYQSHLLQVRELRDILMDSGIEVDHTVVFSSDGTDPRADLAVREIQPQKDFWLIEGLPIGAALRTEIHFENSSVEGVRVQPATKESLRAWFSSNATSLAPGDTLLIYVTDHGRKNPSDLRNNYIVLWGEELSVNEFKGLLSLLPKGVRVISLMSQCYSGSFANAMYMSDRSSRDPREICGYYSSPADRPAYGCYAENRGKNNVGYSFRFFEALRLYGNLHDAHERVLLTDRTPDVPNRSSDHFLEMLLSRAAARQDQSFSAFVDGLLAQSWQDEIHYQSEFEYIDKLGRAFGSFGPRSLRELEERSKNIPRIGKELSGYVRSWKSALNDLARENFDRFLNAYPFWRDYVRHTFVQDLDHEGKRRLGRWLLKDLGAFLDTDPDTRDRLHALRTITEEAKAASYRMEVRRGTVLRIRSLLVRIAGLVYLDRHASDAEQERFGRVEACEEMSLARPLRPSRLKRALPIPFPPLVDEMELLASVMPGWLGVEFAPPDAATRREFELERGAVRITKVLPNSPARAAGIREGDIVLGPPGSYFVERNQIREWIMTSLVGEIRRLDLLRNGRVFSARVRIVAAPL